MLDGRGTEVQSMLAGLITRGVESGVIDTGLDPVRAAAWVQSLLYPAHLDPGLTVAGRDSLLRTIAAYLHPLPCPLRALLDAHAPPDACLWAHGWRPRFWAQRRPDACVRSRAG